jgi:hypothetical protein
MPTDHIIALLIAERDKLNRQARKGQTEVGHPVAETQGILCRERIAVKSCVVHRFFCACCD